MPRMPRASCEADTARRWAHRSQPSAWTSAWTAASGTTDMEAWGGNPVTGRDERSRITLFTPTATASLCVYSVELCSPAEDHTAASPEGARLSLGGPPERTQLLSGRAGAESPGSQAVTGSRPREALASARPPACFHCKGCGGTRG